LLEQTHHLQPKVDVYLVLVGEKAQSEGLLLAEQLRDDMPNLRLLTHCGGGSFKSQFKKADKSGAEVALVLGDDEIQQQQIGLKYLRAGSSGQKMAQESIKINDLSQKINTILNFGETDVNR
jgi:histidyl-tRNA synthetase